MTGTGDDQLAEGFTRGDEACLAEMYRRWGGLVYAVAARSLGDPDEAQDITQQIFVGAWRNRAGYTRDRGSLRAWLLGIARYKVADALALRARLLRAADAAAAVNAGADPHNGAEAVVDQVLLLDELSRLPQAQQDVLRMAFFEDLTQEKIAQRTGLPLGTVKSHTRRGLIQLKRRLEVDDAAH
ncbi:RNA polymerase sigma factor [Streptacidiphilus sp. PAMC 29251]